MSAEEATPVEETPPAETEASKAAGPKKGLKLSYDEYKQMANLMVLYMRKVEEESEGRNRVVYSISGYVFLFSIHTSFRLHSNLPRYQRKLCMCTH